MAVRLFHERGSKGYQLLNNCNREKTFFENAGADRKLALCMKMPVWLSTCFVQAVFFDNDVIESDSGDDESSEDFEAPQYFNPPN